MINIFILNIHLFIPFIIVFAPLLLLELVKRKNENAAENGLLKTGLLLIPLTLIGMLLFIMSGIILYKLMRNSELIEPGRNLDTIITIIMQSFVVYLTARAERRLADSFELKKTKRILALLLMFLLYVAEVALYIYVAIGCTT